MKRGTITAAARAAWLLLLVSSVAVAFWACKPFDLRGIIDGSTGRALSISPSSLVLPMGEAATFTADGGVAPYAFSMVSGGGSIDATGGVYTAPPSPGITTIAVTDATGASAQATITVRASAMVLMISPTAITIQVNHQVTFSALGGSAPYTFSVASGGGSITTTGIYTAPTAAGSAVVRVTDSLGATADACLTIEASGVSLAISPSSISLSVNNDVTFSPVGGVAPYTFAITAAGSGSPGINPSSGYYVAGASPGTDIIQVTDASSVTSTATVTVVAISTNVDYQVPATSLPATGTVGAPIPGGGIFTVQNVGTGTGSMTVFWKVYLSANTTLDGGDLIVASGTTAPLAAGASAPVSLTGTFPSVASGPWNLIAEVRATDDINTLNDNSLASPLTLAPRDINYDVPGVSGSGDIAGQAVTGTFTVHNGGTAAGSATVYWEAYASLDGVPDGSDLLLDRGSTSALGAGVTSADISFAGTWPSTPQDYYVIVTVAAADDILPSNNFAWYGPVNVTGAPPANVDYIVPGVSSSGDVAGRSFSGSFTYKNSGAAAGSQPVYWTAYLSTNDTLEITMDTVVGAGSETALAAGATSSAVSFGGTWPSTPGTAYWLFVSVSASDDVDSLNNFNVKTVTTTAPQVDYIVSSVGSPSTTTKGDLFTCSFTIENVGMDNGSQPVYWTVYGSLDATIDVGTDPVADSGVAAALNAGLTADVSFSATWPYIPDQCYLIAAVTAADDVLPGNNVTPSAQITTTAPNVDYEITDVTGPSEGTAGAELSGSFVVTNVGTHAGTQAVPLRAYISTDAFLDVETDLLIDSGFVPSPGLAAGVGSGTQWFYGTWPLVPGLYYLIVVASAGDDVYAANDWGASAQVDVAAPAVYPDYAITAATTQSTGSPGAPLSASGAHDFTVSNTVANPGTLPIFWNVYVSLDTVLDGSDKPIASGAVGPVAPGSPQTIPFDGSWPAMGSYYRLIVTIGAGDDTNPINNTWVSGSIEVPNIYVEVPTDDNNDSGPTTVELLLVSKPMSTLLPLPAELTAYQLLRITGTNTSGNDGVTKYDTYLVPLAAGVTKLEMRLSWTSGTDDCDMYLWTMTGATGPSVDTAADSEPATPPVTWINLTAGIHYVGVRFLKNNPGMPYTLTLFARP